ncbi:MAG: alpha/beta hydrolase [Chloroflexi bacterium]|nr:alpha/beta hydrolase [Chloroflexota bacterium]
MATQSRILVSTKHGAPRQILTAWLLAAVVSLGIAAGLQANPSGRADNSVATAASAPAAAPSSSIYVEDWGWAGGKPIVFVHGYPLDHRIFEYQMRTLAQQGYRVIALDLPGFGQSPATWEGLDYDGWASAIGTVIRDRNLHDVTLVGYSLGGAVSAHYIATQRDSRVTRLVLLSAALPAVAPTAEVKSALNGYINAVKSDRATFVYDFVKGAFNTPISDRLLDYYAQDGNQTSFHALIRGLEESRDRDLTAEVQRISIPTLILHGTHDGIIPFAAAQATNSLIKGSTLVKLENSGHASFYDAKEEVVNQIIRFAPLSR